MSVMSEIIVSGRNLKSHTTIRAGEKPYECQLCQKSFTTRGILKRHMKTHTGDKPYKCQLCQISFSQSGNLKRHMRTHTGEKPHKCQLCQKSFSQGRGLKRHMRSHTGEKPCMCHLCQKSFSESDYLKRHMITHTGEKPHKCQVCQKSFSRSDDLNSHMRTHTGEKPYKCKLCKKSFTTASALQSHLLYHTGEGPYRCEICDKIFALRVILQRHRRTHATDKQKNRYKSKCSSSATSFELHVGSQPQCLEVESQSTADPSVQFTALTGTNAIDKSNERLSIIMHPDASEENIPLAKTCLKECLSVAITNSLEDEKPFVEKSFGCGLCGEMLEMDTGFQSHCFGHRFSPPHDLFVDMC